MRDDEVARLMQNADVVITNWASRRIPGTVVEAPGQLRYLLCLAAPARPPFP